MEVFQSSIRLSASLSHGLSLLERGGILMVPLLFCSILALWIFLERFYHLRRANGNAELLFDEVRALVLKQDREAAA